MAEHGHKLSEDTVVIVRGRLESRDETPKILCQDIEIFDGILDGAPPLRLQLPGYGLSEERLNVLQRILMEHPGESAVYLHVGGTVLRLGDQYCVDIGSIVGELRADFDSDAVIL
jgi:DNA polymerase III subunit alpha